jgi:hypothetical protein
MFRSILLCSLILGACATDTVDTTSAALSTDLVARTCTRQNTVIGQCGPASSLFAACDLAFTDACTASGGTVGPGAIPLVIHCQDNSSMFHDCDKDFKAACKDEEGAFRCTSTDCSTGKCTL